MTTEVQENDEDSRVASLVNHINFRAKVHKSSQISEETRTMIRQALLYSIFLSTNNKTTARLIVEKFYESLYKRAILTEQDSKSEMALALTIVENPLWRKGTTRR